MTKHGFAAALAGIVLALAAPALAQPSNATPVPPTIASAGVTQAHWDEVVGQVRAHARRAQVPEAALLAAAEAAGVNFARSGRFNARRLQQAVFEKLAQQADEIAELQRRLDALTGDADPSIAPMLTEARAALDAGRLADADRLLAEVAERDLAAIREADAEVERRRLRTGEHIAARAQLASLQADYFTAADHYGRAAGAVPRHRIETRLLYLRHKGEALRVRGERFSDAQALHAAVEVYRSDALPLAPPETRLEDFYVIAEDLGVTYWRLGERGDANALNRAAEMFAVLLRVRSRAVDSSGWARIQMNLGNVLTIMARRGDDAAAARAVTAYEAALTIFTPEHYATSHPLVKTNLATALITIGQRGDDAALHRAIGLLNEVLSMRTRESDPHGWAIARMNLGSALFTLGQRNGDDAALLSSVRNYEESLQVFNPASNPVSWAQAKSGLGDALAALHRRGDHAALPRAIAAFEDALSVLTPENDASDWAQTQLSLANALANQGADDHFDRALQAYQYALQAFTSLNDRENWAAAQRSLGAALLLRGDRAADAMLERAIRAFDSALTVHTREHDAVAWAKAQFGLARALEMLGDRAPPRSAAARQRYDRAVQHLEAAAEVLTPNRDASFAQLISGRLADVARKRGQ